MRNVNLNESKKYLFFDNSCYETETFKARIKYLNGFIQMFSVFVYVKPRKDVPAMLILDDISLDYRNRELLI